MINISHSRIMYRTQKISKSLGTLFKLSKYLPLEIKKTIHYSLINPFLLYGIKFSMAYMAT